MSAEQVQNVDPSVGLYGIYIKKFEEQHTELMRKLLSSEMNAEVLQNSLNQSNEAYKQLDTQFNMALEGLRQTTEERETYKAKAAEFDSVKAELEGAIRQRDDYYRELQHAIDRNNQMNVQIGVIEQNARNAIDRANSLQGELNQSKLDNAEKERLAAELLVQKVGTYRPDPLDIDAAPKKIKKVAKVK